MSKLPPKIFVIIDLVSNVILSIHDKKYFWALVEFFDKYRARVVFSNFERLHESNHEFTVFLIPIVVKRKLDTEKMTIVGVYLPDFTLNFLFPPMLFKSCQDFSKVAVSNVFFSEVEKSSEFPEVLFK